MSAMKVLKTKDESLRDAIIAHGGIVLSRCTDVAGGFIYSLDVSRVDISEVNAGKNPGIYQYQVFSIEHPTLMF